MRLGALALLAVVACESSPATIDAPATERRALGMNDVTMLVPLPGDPAQPVIASLASAQLMVTKGTFVALVLAKNDMGPKSGAAIAYEDFHVVGVRFDLCDRAEIGPCRDTEGRLRLVLQPLFVRDGVTAAHDIAIHMFFPIPASELAGVVAELRILSQLQNAALDSPLAVHPALARGDRDYTDRLRALVLRYAHAEELLRITAFGQDKNSAAFAWIFRGFERQADKTFTNKVIPEVNTHQQHVLVAGGDTIYNIEPFRDSPGGLRFATSGTRFAEANADERRLSLEALAAIQNPLRHDAVDLQCVSCHVASFLSVHRAETAGIELATLDQGYRTPYNTRVDTVVNRDGRVLRALGWAHDQPVISQRVANDTAQVLTEIEARFP